ncbi:MULTISPECIES: hypothetical protein [Pseudoalteromonas]|uniref:Uncharacterized protein n=1 Tax=Pseudoalteromonas luteoviolacea (strain 2ta16) TaxID=1353533 RepID=V4HS81_PSEL2|nr:MULTISPECIES: hypothetical protein [Pseudoalteromonas]ESP93690.1 hypothetical protein PL2TA16_02894 [Pseudoalteromonas luteoviolacea 2ta16]KZN41192.1 hypothetical protein N483_16405 [Pseudoalteromonas luteoviolacea NCIMB 1944]MCG7550060.1 hypothetical protein [Pseudoalteromonas sp. Of7M-16]
MKKIALLSLLLMTSFVQAKEVTCSDKIDSISLQSSGSVWIWPDRHETIELKPTHPKFYEFLGIMFYAMKSGKTVVYKSDNGERYSNKCHDTETSLYPLYEILRVN